MPNLLETCNLKVLNELLTDKVGEIIVTDMDCRLIARNNGLGFSDDKWRAWAVTFFADFDESSAFEWEIADKESDCYYKVRSFYVKEGLLKAGGEGIVHHLVDVSEYAGLFRDLSTYSGELRRISKCQSMLMEDLTDDPSGCLPIAIDVFGVDHVCLRIVRRGHEQVRFLNKDGSESRPGESGMHCICEGRTSSGDEYALLASDGEEAGRRLQSLLSGEFRLYIENALLRDAIIYENEHDSMTGLYNRVKFSELAAGRITSCHSIAVYNLDVNYLKRTNDEYGHEAGNSLLIKAANSLKAVESDDIYGFRMGGDEFCLIALDVSREEAEAIRDRWREALSMINEEEPFPECVMACGLAWTKAPFVLRNVMEESDELMYADKRAIKISRGEDPDAR